MAHSLAVRPSVGPRTWTVIDEGYRTVAPVEEWLEAHRHLWSPNTVRGYATSLAQWWTFLEQRAEAERWGEVGVPAVSGFLSWLRNGRTVEHALVAPRDAPSRTVRRFVSSASSTLSPPTRRSSARSRLVSAPPGFLPFSVLPSGFELADWTCSRTRQMWRVCCDAPGL